MQGRRVSVRYRVCRYTTRLMVVEEYIRYLDDGDMLMDMMSANAGFERTTVKRGENIYPEVCRRGFVSSGAHNNKTPSSTPRAVRPDR
jgi:hypothetical protein